MEELKQGIREYIKENKIQAGSVLVIYDENAPDTDHKRFDKIVTDRDVELGEMKYRLLTLNGFYKNTICRKSYDTVEELITYYFNKIIK